MQTLFNGVEVFTNSDTYDLADDVAEAFKTANLLIRVGSTGQRDLLETIAPGGVLPDGTTVVRTDIAGCPSETWDGTKWHPSRGTLILGHMGKTDGNQVISGTTAVAFNGAQVLRGGVTFSDAQESLLIPNTGLYRVTVGARFGGSGTGMCIAEVWKNANVNTGLQTRGYKDAAGEPFPSVSGTIQLTAGDNLFVVVYGPAQYVYGANGYNGTFLEVEYVGQ